jgi:hypothetical protein
LGVQCFSRHRGLPRRRIDNHGGGLMSKKHQYDCCRTIGTGSSTPTTLVWVNPRPTFTSRAGGGPGNTTDLVGWRADHLGHRRGSLCLPAIEKAKQGGISFHRHEEEATILVAMFCVRCFWRPCPLVQKPVARTSGRASSRAARDVGKSAAKVAPLPVWAAMAPAEQATMMELARPSVPALPRSPWSCCFPC